MSVQPRATTAAYDDMRDRWLLACAVGGALVAVHIATAITVSISILSPRETITTLARLIGEAGGEGSAATATLIRIGITAGALFLGALFLVLCVRALYRRVFVLNRSGDGFSEVKDFRAKNKAHSSRIPFAFLNGKPLFDREEDTAAVLAMTGMGKTTRVVVQWIKRATGPVVSTSTKPDVVRLTAQFRAEVGTVHVFDPEGVMQWPAPTRWDIVAGCEKDIVAMERANAIVAARPMGSGEKNANFFAEACATILRCFLHAAALEKLSMRSVMSWSQDFSKDEALNILARHPDARPDWDAALRKFTRGEARETVSSTEQTLSTILKAFSIEMILDSVCPEPGEGFDVEAFVKSTDTIYLLTQSGGDALAAPVITTLVESIQKTATRLATRTREGKLDPPLWNALDEVPNVCPIPSLTSVMSDGRGHGIKTLVVAQNRSQLEQRYDAAGTRTILNNSAIFLMLGGSKDTDHLRELSTLSGEREIHKTTESMSGLRESSVSVSASKERVITEGQIAQLPEGKGFLLYRELEPSIVDLPAWYESADAALYTDSEKWTIRQEGYQA